MLLLLTVQVPSTHFPALQSLSVMHEDCAWQLPLTHFSDGPHSVSLVHDDAGTSWHFPSGLHTPLAQSVSTLQLVPVVLELAAVAHILSAQLSDEQSLLWMHDFPSSHPGQLPPQLVSVSSPSIMLLSHVEVVV